MAGHRDPNLSPTSAVSGAPGNGQPRSFERYSWPTNGQQPERCSLWYAHLMKQNDAPDPAGRIAEAYKYILTVRRAVYKDPCLKKGRPGRKSPVPDEKATKLREERNGENRLLEQLSRCYRLEEGWGKKGQQVWSRLNLLNEGKIVPDRSSTDYIPLTCVPLSAGGSGGSLPPKINSRQPAHCDPI